MVSLAEAGLSCAEIGRRVGINRSTVRTLLIPRGVSFRKSETFWTDQELAAAARMTEQGCSFSEIGKALGRSAEAVRNKMNDSGLHESEQPKVHIVDLRPSQEVLAARERKYELEAKRTLGAILMGDPPPGFSALDQKRHKGWQAQLAPWGRS